MAKSNERTFTIHEASHADGCKTKYKVKGNSGRYVSRDARSAARKAVNSLCRRKRIRGRCVLFISVRETTQGAKTHNKVYTYRFTRRKADKPGPFGQEYEVVGKSVGAVPLEDCPKSRKSSGRMFSRTAKGKTVKHSGRKSSRKSSKRSGKKSSGKKSKSAKKSSGKKSSRKSSKKSSKKSKSKSGKKSRKQSKGFLASIFG